MVGTAVAVQWGGSHWWIEQVAVVVEELGLGRDGTGREAIKAVLKRVAWTDVFFEPMSNDVWKSMVGLVGLRRNGAGNESVEEDGAEEDEEGSGVRDELEIGMMTLPVLEGY